MKRGCSRPSACAIALIGKLSPTLHSRSIEIALQRRRPDEPVRSFRADRVSDQFARQCRRWVIDLGYELARIDPDCRGADQSHGRQLACPVWVAEVVGGPRPERVAEAARELTGEAWRGPDGLAQRLLADIRATFYAENVDRMSSESLITALIADPEKP